MPPMTTTELWIPIALVGWALFVVALVAAFTLRRRRDRLRQVLDGYDEAAKTAVHELDEMRDEVDRTRQQRDEADRRRQELFERIEGFLGERDQWRELYYTQVSEHGAAQALMMRNLGAYEHHCQAVRNRVRKARTLEEAQEAAAKKPPVDYRTLEVIAREFVQSHLGAEEGAAERLARLKERVDAQAAPAAAEAQLPSPEG